MSGLTVSGNMVLKVHLDVSNVRVQKFSKKYFLSQNSGRQERHSKQVPYWRPKNITASPNKMYSTGRPVHGICTFVWVHIFFLPNSLLHQGVILWSGGDDDDSTKGNAPRPYVDRPFVPHI
jgi:hypothetical protein